MMKNWLPLVDLVDVGPRLLEVGRVYTRTPVSVLLLEEAIGGSKTFANRRVTLVDESGSGASQKRFLHALRKIDHEHDLQPA